MKIAITGGTGFVGQALIRRLCQSQAGHDLRCITRDLNRRADVPGSADVEWVQGDLADDGWQNGFVEGCDAVVHSGLWRTHRSFRGEEGDLVEYLRVNFLGTIKLIEAAIEAGVKRFVFLSTCAVHEKILDDRPLDECHPLWATHHYGAHKAALEKFVHSYGLGAGFDVCALRPTGIYGVAEPVENSKWFPMIEQVARGEDVEVLGGGKEVHVDDVAAAVDLLLHTQASVRGEAFACYDQYISQFQVATLAKEILNSKSVIHGEAKSPRHQIVTEKIRRLGMTFGGDRLLSDTVRDLAIHAQKSVAANS